MIELNWVGKILILFGVVLIVVGLFFFMANRIPWLGRLPGDIYIHKKNFTFFFPLTTCIIISIILSFIFYLLSKR